MTLPGCDLTIGLVDADGFVEDQLEEWKGAYRVLDAPLSAPADFIKENYRTLVKRWHPDHYAAGSAEQVEAAEMTRLINTEK